MPFPTIHGTCTQWLNITKEPSPCYNGNYIRIKHPNGLETCYSHNSKNLVKKGDRVKAGQVIALVGQTGRATTPHLHFEVRINGKTRNPANYFDLNKGIVRKNFRPSRK